MKKEKTFAFRFLLFGILLSLCTNLAVAQSVNTISGTVKDSNNQPVAGVAVMVVGSNVGVVTAASGEYSIKATTSQTLRFSSLGYTSQDIKVGTQTTINVTLAEDSEQIDDVIVIGYGSVRKKDLTGATSSVAGSALVEVPVSSAAQALTGKMAGVSVITQSGAPGADVNITVRGGSSITQSNHPIYIVDGFLMEDALKYINANDIQSIDVMKDASATAIYGAQASNGVVLITTKSGRTGKTDVTYNGYVSFERLGNSIDLLGVEDYAKYQYELQTLATKEANWANYFGGGNPSDPGFYTGAYDYISSEYGNRAGIDWQDVMFGSTALTQNHNVSITGGNERTKVFLSYNNITQDGLQAKSGFVSNSVRAKLNHEIRKGIRIDFSSNFLNTVTDGGGSLGGSLKLAALQPVTGGARFTNEELVNSDVSEQMQAYDTQYDIYNPIIQNDAVTKKKYTRAITTNFGLEIDILKNLTFRTAGNYYWRQVRDDYWDDGRTSTAKREKGGPWGKRDNSERFNWTITNTLNWKKDFNRHSLNLMAGHEVYYQETMNLKNEYRGFPEDNFELNHTGAASTNISSSSKAMQGLVSVFGRVMYSYDDRYLLTATLRGDGSSKFARDNQWGYLPSVAVAWRISEEQFMQNQNIVGNLKLRVGLGRVGNCNIDDASYRTDYGAGYYAIGNSTINALKPGSMLGNPGLVWEQTTSTNIGVDFSLLKNRINVTADWYNNVSDNLLLKANIPASSGYTQQTQNIGKFRNRGFEIALNTVNIRSNKEGGFTWTSDLNMTFNKSKVLRLFGESGNDYFDNSYESRVTYRVQVGHALGQFYGYQYDGVYTTDDFTDNGDGTFTLRPGVAYDNSIGNVNIKPGDIKYKTPAGQTDASGNPVWTAADMTYIGSAEPKFYGGFTNTFTYKGFDLSVFMNFSYGGKIFSMNTQRFIGPYLPNQNSLAIMSDYYKLIDPTTGKMATTLDRIAELNPNQKSKDQLWSLNSKNSTAVSAHMDYFLEDASFLRLNTITLGYTFPKQWLKKAHIGNLRVYCTLNNIHTFTNYTGFDPEVSATSSAITKGIDNSAYPRSKSFVAGINLTF